MSTLSLDDIDIHTIARYETDGYPWEAWDLLRETAPCFWYERDDIEPFWAITRHADVKAVGAGRPPVRKRPGPAAAEEPGHRRPDQGRDGPAGAAVRLGPRRAGPTWCSSTPPSTPTSG